MVCEPSDRPVAIPAFHGALKEQDKYEPALRRVEEKFLDMKDWLEEPGRLKALTVKVLKEGR